VSTAKGIEISAPKESLPITSTAAPALVRAACLLLDGYDIPSSYTSLCLSITEVFPATDLNVKYIFPALSLKERASS